MKLDSLKNLYLHELNDLHDAESQLVIALPKMAKAASSEDLRLAFERHLVQTQEHVRRLDRAFSLLVEQPTRTVCRAMTGLLEEVAEMTTADGDSVVKDAGLISAAQRIEHYEMAGYGCARSYAETLGEGRAAELLHKTLEEERATDKSLTQLAEGLMIRVEPVYA